MISPDDRKEVRSVCPYCGVGCGIRMTGQADGSRRVSGDPFHPANFGRLCTKGSTSAEILNTNGRMTEAWFRTGRTGKGEPVGIDTAIRKTASRLNEILSRNGPGSVSFYVSGQMSLEAQYLANKLAKGFIGTNHIDSNSRLCMSSAAAGYQLSLGADAPPGSYSDIEESDCFLLIGSNMAECHPVLYLRILDRIRLSGAKLIVIDPRKTATAANADLFMPVRPGTDLALLNGLLHLILKNGAADSRFIRERTEGFEELREFLKDFPPAKVSEMTGIPVPDLERAAAWFGESREAVTFWTMGINQRIQGTWMTNAICNLHLATGKINRPGSGPFSLTGQPNAMGGREMGYLSHGLPGQRAVTSAEDRQFVEKLWKIPSGSINPLPGFDAVRLFERLASGELKAVWIICTNPVASMPNRKKIIEALRAAELVICQDIYLETETTRYADILLPAALWAESEGVMVNSERTMTLMQKAVDPPGSALPDWEIIARIGSAMGFSPAFDFGNSEAVFEEIRNFSNPRTGYEIGGIDYERLRKGPVQWPAPRGGADRNRFRYLPSRNSSDPAPLFPTENGRAKFFCRPYQPPAETPDDHFPVYLNTGRLPHQWHTLTKTGKIPALNRLDPAPFLELHPEDAARLGVNEGDSVEIRSRRGFAVLPARITGRSSPGRCFAPFHWGDLFGEEISINSVTQDCTDPVSKQPELKISAVKLTKVMRDPERSSEIPRIYRSPLLLSGPRTDSGQTLALTPLILFGSQTGNAEKIAVGLAGRLAAAGIGSRVLSMSDLLPEHLCRERLLLVVTSTYGDGGPPDNAVRFWNALRNESLSLDGLRYALFALGSSSYRQFCRFGRDLSIRLEELGARALIDPEECDGPAEARAESWNRSLIDTIPDWIREPAAGREGERLSIETEKKERLIVVGNGMAGIAAVEQILALRGKFRITVFGSETWPNYNRILLSDVLSGKKSPEDTILNPREWYEKNGIELHTGRKITNVDPAQKEVLDADGNRFSYDKLLLATGSHPYIPPVRGVEKRGVFAYRNLDDTSRMIECARGAHKAAVIGGGLLGLEAGRALVQRGLHVTIFHLTDRLMELQLDEPSAEILKKEVERLGMVVHLNHAITGIIGNDSVEGISFSNGKAYEADMVIFSTGIRPAVELAKSAGLDIGRGIRVSDYLETSHPDIFAVGECVEHRGKTYGIVAPLYEQARIVARVLTGLRDQKYQGSIESTTLKVAGIDLVSMGNYLGNSPGCEMLTYSDPAASVYKKVVLQGNRVVGAILMGDIADSARLMQLVKAQTDVTLFRRNLMTGEPAPQKGSQIPLKESDVICGCMGVDKQTIVRAISECNLTTREGVGLKTKACTSCKSCGPLIDQILQEVLGGEYVPVEKEEKPFCGCFDLSRIQLISRIRELQILSATEVINALGNGIGCAYCKPGLSYLLSEIWFEKHREERSARFINDRVHANIQKDGTFSVVPRMYGGVTSAGELRKIADVAEKYRVPMIKLTGGQRIDLLGVRKENLPLIWADLGMPSGHAYAKAIRTVKTCVGTEFCRFGVQDSTRFGIRLEKSFEGLHTPHKVKMAVSGCPRNCAESYVKDIGVVAIQTGWEIYVGGAAGMTVRKGDLLATVASEDEALRVATLFLQFYREEGNYLERTYDFVARIGIDQIRKVLLDPESRRAAELLDHFNLSKDAAVDPWKRERERPVHPFQFKELVSIEERSD